MPQMEEKFLYWKNYIYLPILSTVDLQPEPLKRISRERNFFQATS